MQTTYDGAGNATMSGTSTERLNLATQVLTPNTVFKESDTGNQYVLNSSFAWVEAGSAGNVVTSVFTRKGAVVAVSGDYTPAQVGFSAYPIISADIASSAVSAVKLGSVTDGTTLDQSGAGSTIEIKALGVGTGQIAANAVTIAKLATSGITDGVTLDQSGAGNTFEIKAGGVSSTQIGTLSGTLALTNTNPFSMANAQTLTVALTAQTVGAATLTVPNFASVNDTFAFITLSQTLSNKTLSSPTISGTIAGTYNIGGTPTLTQNLALSGARTISAASNTASALLVTDGTNNYLAINTQTGTVSISAITLSASAPTFALAAGSTYSLVSISAITLTDSATTTVTALNGIALNIAAPTINQSGGAFTVTTASSLYISGAPVPGASVTTTNPYAFQVAAGISAFGSYALFLGSTIPIATVNGIGTDANAGNMVINIVSGKVLAIKIAGANVFSLNSTTWNVGADNTQSIGTSALRVKSFAYAVSIQGFGTVSDANPQVQLNAVSSTGLAMGAGGASATDVSITRGATNNITLTASAGYTLTGKITTYGNWAPTNAFSAPNLVRATTSPTNVANSAASTTLTMALAASTNYAFDVYIFFTNASASSANFQIHALGSASLVFVGGMMDTTALTAVEDGIATATGTNIFGTSCTSNGNGFVHFHGILTGGGSTDTLQIDFINPAAAGTLTLNAGSFMSVKQIA